MRTPAPTLLPLLRSQTQAQILALLYLNPEREFSLGELASLADVSVQSAHKEVNRLTSTGFTTDRKMGTSRLVRANTSSPVARPLTDLLALTYGPVPVLSRELAPVVGIEQAYIYGSWAARFAGETGAAPHDIDVLVVGHPDLDELDAAARRAEKSLLREVNIQRVRPNTWRANEDAFVRTLHERPLIPIKLEQEKTA